MNKDQKQFLEARLSKAIESRSPPRHDQYDNRLLPHDLRVRKKLAAQIDKEIERYHEKLVEERNRIIAKVRRSADFVQEFIYGNDFDKALAALKKFERMKS